MKTQVVQKELALSISSWLAQRYFLRAVYEFPMSSVL